MAWGVHHIIVCAKSRFIAAPAVLACVLLFSHSAGVLDPPTQLANLGCWESGYP
jgi:hypothetical protein